MPTIIHKYPPGDRQSSTLCKLSKDKMEGTMSGATVAKRIFLHIIVASCIGLFVAITFMRPVPTYSTNEDLELAMLGMDLPWGGEVALPMETVKNKKGQMVTQPIGREVPLWSGRNAFPVVLQWGTLMIAALATAGLRHLAPNPAHQPYTPKHTTNMFMLKVRQLLSARIPPADIWQWWCGGLNVFELFLVLVWLALTLIYLTYYIVRNYNRIQATDDAEWAIERLEGFAACSGKLLFLLVMIMFLPISRSNFLQWLFGTDYTTLIKYHRWLSKGTILFVFVHSLAYMILWGAEGTLSDNINWDTSVKRKARMNVCGVIACVAGLVIYFFSSNYFQQKHFWLFYHVHIWGFLVFTSFAMMHYKGYVNWMFPALVLYGIDRGFRYWQMAVNWTTIRPSDVVIDSTMITMQLRWQQNGGKAIYAGQHAWLRCPGISIFEAHPFSVADVQKGEDTTVLVTMHMRCFGAWTKKFANKIAQGCSLAAQVEGPYLATLDHTTKFNTAPVIVMVAGGIGVTPLLGLLRHYARQFADILPGNNNASHPKVYFVWTSRHLSDLKLFGADLLSACRSSATSSPSSSSPRSSSSDTTKPTLDKNVLQTCMSSNTGDVPSASTSQMVTRISSEGKSSGWLHAALHYTGFELENDQGLKVNMLPERVSLNHSGSDGGNNTVPRALQAHPMLRPWLYAVCVFLGFFGAWAGLLVGAYYENYNSRISATGADYQASAMVYCVAIAAGSILVPFAVLALHWAIVSRRNKAADDASSSAGADFSDPQLSKQFSVSSATEGYTTSLTVLPGYVLAPQSEVGGVTLGRGRPDIRSVLRAVARLHGDLKEIPVLVAASDSVALPLENEVSAHNGTGADGPVFTITRVAHHH